jgi:hypothetical protein
LRHIKRAARATDWWGGCGEMVERRVGVAYVVAEVVSLLFGKVRIASVAKQVVVGGQGLIFDGGVEAHRRVGTIQQKVARHWLLGASMATAGGSSSSWVCLNGTAFTSGRHMTQRHVLTSWALVASMREKQWARWQ